MNDDRIQEIIKILRENDTNSVPFAKTKDELLGQGYQEKEIVYALYMFPYDGKPNPKPEDNVVQKYYESHPGESDKLAKSLLNEIAQQEFEMAAIYGMASEVSGRFGDRQAEGYYGLRYADEVGFPYYKMLLLTIAVAALAYKFPTFWYVYAALGIAGNIWLYYLGFKKYQATRKK